MIIAPHFLFFCTVCIRHKASPSQPFGALFTLFLLPSSTIHPFPSIRTNSHPSAPIHTTFRQTPPNVMSGEISPAIGAEKMSHLLIFASLCLVLLCARALLPQRTHANPSVPIFNHIFVYIVYSYVCSYVRLFHLENSEPAYTC